MNASSFSNLSELSGSSLAESGVAIGLGIAGLPELTSDMVEGGLYVLSVRTSSARFPLLSGSLQSALNAGLRCTIVTASEPADFLVRLDTANGFSSADYLNDGQLSVFSMQEEFGKKMFLFGADRLVQELEEFEVPIGGFVVFEQADDLLSLHDVGLALQQVKILAKWFKQRQVTGLLAFSQSNDQKLETLNNLLDHLTGIVRLGGDRDGLELTFLYWRSTQGVIAAQNHRVYTNDAGLYEVSRRRVERSEEFEARLLEDEDNQDWRAQRVPPGSRGHFVPKAQSQQQDLSQSDTAPAFLRGSSSASTLRPTADSNRPHAYLYSDPELDVLQDLVPGDWQFVVKMEHIVHVALDKPRAMILVSTDQSVAAIDLSRTIHMMRKTLGLDVQILVRETHQSVDEGYKQLLLQSGANVVVSRDIALEYYPKFLSSLRHQKFSRSFEPDFASILAELSTTGHLHLDQTKANPSTSYLFAAGSAAKSEPIAQRAIAKARRSSMAV